LLFPGFEKAKQKITGLVCFNAPANKVPWSKYVHQSFSFIIRIFLNNCLVLESKNIRKDFTNRRFINGVSLLVSAKENVLKVILANKTNQSYTSFDYLG